MVHGFPIKVEIKRFKCIGCGKVGVEGKSARFDFTFVSVQLLLSKNSIMKCVSNLNRIESDWFVISVKLVT